MDLQARLERLPSAPGSRQSWGGAVGATLPWLIANISKTCEKPLCIITPDMHMARRLAREIGFFHAPENGIKLFPDWETLPYDQFSPHQDIISDRLATLAELYAKDAGIIIAPVTTLMYRLPPTSYIHGQSFNFKKGADVSLEVLAERLTRAGYRSVNNVFEHGEFAKRGSIIDVFPMGANKPFRLDLFDNEIDAIRMFDVETQRSRDECETIELLPGREFPFDEASIHRFRRAWRERFAGNAMQCPTYEDVSNGIVPAGIEYYLPFFFEEMATFFDYLPTNTLILECGNTVEQSEKFFNELKTRHEQMQYDMTRPLLAPSDIALPTSDFFAACNNFPRLHITDKSIEEKTGRHQFPFTAIPDISVEQRKQSPFNKLSDYIQNSDSRILFCAESLGRRETLTTLLAEHGIRTTNVENWRDFLVSDSNVCLTIAPLDKGAEFSEPNLSLIVETDLFPQHVMQRRSREWAHHDPEVIIRDLTELHIGDPVVHIDHGIARYNGLITLNIMNITGEFVELTYANDDKIFVPITDLHLISRYTGGDPEHAPLHKLGTDKWSRSKQKAAEKIRDVAAELLALYAQREAVKGIQFPAIDKDYYAFAHDFPFEETPDQEKAIISIVDDMTSGRKMDRLVCGDVGFGKTEVAMRAAFIAAHSGKQVCLLAPTTLLVAQHTESFQNRFAAWPFTIKGISRFSTAKEQKQILDDLTSGKIDIVIGTHKLLQKGVNFKDLGLLVIDEEHRFGVRQKEQLKKLRADVDFLALTATPIPRTLSMAMSGLRDISIIATPPARRLTIKTFVRPRNKTIIREAILREIMRGGQVFYLHNKVETIARTAEDVQELVPEAKIIVAHGQMHERELEHVMADFYHRRYHVFVCTTIIETGIDIPSANTIIIERADRFGLAQLHQLRGRVGRSHHQAYAYLFTPPPKAMTSDAKKRLQAISELEDLGAGFMLATHDLEIRGAGELLGDEQSGHMQTVGFSLYMEMLDTAVKQLQRGEKILDVIPQAESQEINLKIPALLPETYVADVQLRLATYKRISSCHTSEDLHELQAEIIDRFGQLPDAAKNLFAISQLRMQAKRLGIQKIEMTERGGIIEFEENPAINTKHLIELIQKESNTYQLAGPTVLQMKKQTKSHERLECVRGLLAKLAI